MSKRGHAGSILVSGKKKIYRRKKNKNKKNRNGRKNKNNRNKKKNKNKQNNIEQISVVQNAEALANELSRQGKSAIGPSLNFLTTSKNPSSEPLLPQPNNPKIRTQNSRSFDFRTGRQTNTDKVIFSWQKPHLSCAPSRTPFAKPPWSRCCSLSCQGWR